MWLRGDRRANQAGRYGSLGVASMSNYPAGREGSSMVIDVIQKEIYLFGGLWGAALGRTLRVDGLISKFATVY